MYIPLKISLKDKIKARYKKFVYHFKIWFFLKQPFYILPILAIYAIFWQAKDRKVNPNHYRLHGVYCFDGLYGSGKSLSMNYFLYQQYLKNPKVLIVSNIPLEYFDYVDLENTKQIEEMQHPHGIIFVIDESQLSFNSRDFKNFPWEMVSAITQNRKEGKCLLFASQNFYHIDKQIRDLCFRIIHCNSYLGLFFLNKWYLPQDYELAFNPVEGKRPRTYGMTFFIGNPLIFNAIQSHKKVKRLGTSKDKIE